MTEQYAGELTMVHDIEMIDRLPFGSGRIGQKYPLSSPEEERAFAEALGERVVPLTKRNTAGCVDERTTLSLADGTDDAEILSGLVTYQLPGGLYLATTKALVAADAAIVRDAPDFTAAYLKVGSMMNELGYEDGGHAGCGASGKVRESVANPLSTDQLLTVMPALVPTDARTPQLLELNAEVKAQRLESGFYDSWTSDWHENHLRETVPGNFAHLQDDPEDHETHGHYASGALIINDPALGFAKNRFNAETGRMAFGYTPTLTYEVAGRLAVSDEERSRIMLGFADDAASVFDRLVINGLPVFSERASTRTVI